MRTIIFVALLMPVLAQAQFKGNINLPDHDSKRLRFGINVGGNQSHYNFIRHPQFLEQDSITIVESINSTGINLAWLVNVNLSEHLDFRTYPLNLTFTEKAFQYKLRFPQRAFDEDTLTTKKIQGISLALPLQIKFSSDRIENFKVYMMAGVRGEYDFAAAKKAVGNEQLIKLNKFDYGLEAGIGFHFYFPVFVLTPELKISYGLSNVHQRDEALKYSNVIDKINSRSVSFSLTVE